MDVCAFGTKLAVTLRGKPESQPANLDTLCRLLFPLHGAGNMTNDSARRRRKKKKNWCIISDEYRSRHRQLRVFSGQEGGILCNFFVFSIVRLADERWMTNTTTATRLKRKKKVARARQERGLLTLAKYLQMFSEAAPRSWLKGQALPAWQAPWRKNLHGTCDVSASSSKRSAHL